MQSKDITKLKSKVIIEICDYVRDTYRDLPNHEQSKNTAETIELAIKTMLDICLGFPFTIKHFNVDSFDSVQMIVEFEGDKSKRDSVNIKFWL